MGESSDEINPEDVSLPSQFLLPNLDDSSDDEDTKFTELVTEAEINNTIPEEEMPSVNSEATSLVNTNEFLEFMDTIDMGESEKTNQSEFGENSDQSDVLEESNPIEQTSVDPKSESQFSSFISYHEGESSSLKNPSTVEQELSKSSEIECTVKNDSGVNDQSDISSHLPMMLKSLVLHLLKFLLLILQLLKLRIKLKVAGQRLNQNLPYRLK